MLKLGELREKAERATPGDWQNCRANYPQDGEYDWSISTEIDGQRQCIAEVFGRTSESTRPDAEATSRFIAACNPQTVLVLLKELERAVLALDECAQFGEGWESHIVSTALAKIRERIEL